MSASAGLVAFKLSFQLSPIILTGGIAGAIPGGMLPIVAVTESLNLAFGLLGAPSGGDGLDGFFANFHPQPGSTLIAQRLGEYTFANQAVAANATIADPLVVSMLMIVPARTRGGVAVKLATMMALKATLDQHHQQGGTYTVATPSFFYTDCMMLGMRDVSPAALKQPQVAWQLDFRKPLLTLDQAQQAQNSLMSRITSGGAINGPPAWSGLGPAVGLPPSLAAPSLIPTSSGAAGAGVAGAVDSAEPFLAGAAP